MCERTIYPYGAIAKRLGNTTLVVGFSLVWDRETAEWFVRRSNENSLQQYGYWNIIPLPGYIEGVK